MCLSSLTDFFITKRNAPYWAYLYTKLYSKLIIKNLTIFDIQNNCCMRRTFANSLSGKKQAVGLFWGFLSILSNNEKLYCPKFIEIDVRQSRAFWTFSSSGACHFKFKPTVVDWLVANHVHPDHRWFSWWISIIALVSVTPYCLIPCSPIIIFTSSH
jgi:hypothetical protein